jgi:L,D-peptidoglycan transpeptidase YkuD (ErfK/YbiS/YcfS/YnhG family)
MSCNAGNRNIRIQSGQKGYANRVESHVISNAYKKNRRLSTIRVSPAAGAFRPRRLWWRADRHPRPRTFLAVRAIKPEDAWCEDPESRHYNQPVRRHRDQDGDRLKRDDHLYDFIVEIDHNSSPRIKGRGSAVFLHLARENFGPTAGCVSMTRSSMLRLLRRLGPETKIVIG